jgi:hypothetical protein
MRFLFLRPPTYPFGNLGEFLVLYVEIGCVDTWFRWRFRGKIEVCILIIRPGEVLMGTHFGEPPQIPHREIGILIQITDREAKSVLLGNCTKTVSVDVRRSREYTRFIRSNDVTQCQFSMKIVLYTVNKFSSAVSLHG